MVDTTSRPPTSCAVALVVADAGATLAATTAVEDRTSALPRVTARRNGDVAMADLFTARSMLQTGSRARTTAVLAGDERHWPRVGARPARGRGKRARCRSTAT